MSGEIVRDRLARSRSLENGRFAISPFGYECRGTSDCAPFGYARFASVPFACGLLVLAAFGLLAAGCSGGRIAELREAKTCHDRGDFECVAAVGVACAPEQEGCNQLHLLKGDACFRLAGGASTEDAAIAHYRCAADHLEAGVRQTEDWMPMGDHVAWRTNLLEALRGWQDRESGEQALELLRRLLTAAQDFEAVLPDHPAAIYFEIGARYALLQPEIVAGDDPELLCDTLTTLSRRLESAAPSAQGTPYEPNYAQLTSDLATATSLIPGCQ